MTAEAPESSVPRDRGDAPRPPLSRASRRAVLPGLSLCVVGGGIAWGINRLVPAVSPLLAAIVLGVVLANVVSLPDRLLPGVAMAGKRVLRIGIVLLGLRLSLHDLAALGWGVIAVDVAVVSLGIGAALLWARLLGTGRNLSLLIACGFSICGAAAVAAVDGVVEADEEDVATAIALVVLFGTVSIPLAPWLARTAGFDLYGQSVFTGASVHEVAQVVAAAGLLGSAALATAVLVKLGRVLLLAPVLAGVALWRRRSSASASAARPPLVPLFVAGFMAAVLTRSFLPLPAAALGVSLQVEQALLATAMFALGLGVKAAVLRQVGPRPLLLGVLTTATICLVAGVAVAVL